MPYRAAMIGLGPRARGHMEGIQKTEGIELVAAVDISSARCEAWHKSYGGNCYTDLQEALQCQKPDVAVVCTGEKPRYQLARAAMDANVRCVVLEKPMAATLGEAKNLMEKAQALGVRVVVSHQMRFADEFVAAKEAIHRGEIGQPYFLRASSYGHLMEQGPHMVDMLLYLLAGELAGPNPVEWVMGQVADVEEGLSTVHPAPAFVVGYIAFRGHIRAVVECGRRFAPAMGLSPGETWLQKRVQVLGTEGMTDSIVAHWCHLHSQAGKQTLASGSEGWDQSTIRLYEELVQVLTHGGEHRCNGHVALTGFEIIHAIYESARRGDRVPVPLQLTSEPLPVLMARAPRAV